MCLLLILIPGLLHFVAAFNSVKLINVLILILHNLYFYFVYNVIYLFASSFSFNTHVDLFTYIRAVGSKALKSLCCIVMHNLRTLNKALLTYLLTDHE